MSFFPRATLRRLKPMLHAILVESPTEILLAVCDHLSFRDVYVLLRTSRRLNRILNTYFYTSLIREGLGQDFLCWTAARGCVVVFQRLLAHGVQIGRPFGAQDLHAPLLAALGGCAASAEEDRPAALVLRGREDIVRWCLANGADVAGQNASGETALHVASKALSPVPPVVLEMLLARGADIEARNRKGHTPLFVAATCRNAGVVRFLAEHDANANFVDPHSHTALSQAVQALDLPTVEALLESGRCSSRTINRQSPAGEKPLHVAARYGHAKIVCALLRRRARVNTYTRTQVDPLTPLMMAVRGLDHLDPLLSDDLILRKATAEELQQRFETISLLLSHRADVDMRNPAGKTALHYACAVQFYGHREATLEYRRRVVSLLLRHGPDVHVLCACGRTPLYYAAVHLDPSADVLSALVRAGADVSAVTERGCTALHNVCGKKHPKNDPTGCVDVLVEAGARVNALCYAFNYETNALNAEPTTPLMLAARHGNVDAIRALVRNGAHLNTRGPQGRTALGIARHGGHDPAVRVLRENGATD